MSVIRLTERKLKDTRFRKTEEAIFKVFFDGENGIKLNVNEITAKIGVDRATFYRHHRAACEIEEDYERYILEKYIKLIQGIKMKGDIELRKLYYEMLIFILHNRKIFEALLKRRNLRVIGEMIEMLGPEVQLSNNSERVFRVYIGEVVGLIVDWGMEGFRETEIVKLLDNIEYITDTVGERLKMLRN